MTIPSRLVGRLVRLPPPETTAVEVDHDLAVTMPDGAVLLADRYAPRGAGRPPLVLVRSPYGRRGLFGLLYGRLFAERGFQVLIQSCRGTFGSGGRFDPFGNERDDGLATLEWLRRQPWYPGAFGTVGPSYLGLVQWAIARDAGDDLKALALQVTASEFRGQTYAGGSYSLESALSWSHLTVNQEKRLDRLRRLLGSTRRLRPLYRRLPLRDLDRLATGSEIPYYQEWLAHDQPGDAYWTARGYDAGLAEVTAPVNLLGGWYDIFLPWQLQDYARLRAAGRRPYLTIGPWSHGDSGLLAAALRESFTWLRANLLGERDGLREQPVRVFVTGAGPGAWRDLPDWPPPSKPQRWHLRPEGGLATGEPVASAPDSYTYDPADPTPALSGPILFGKARPTDNRELEARPDVLTYTGAPLEGDLEVLGGVTVELYARSSREHTDFFARLCDVEPSGRSLNVCDALLRLAPGQPAARPDGTILARIELWHTAHRFRRGHRIRLQVSSGAHPRFARNLGGGEPLATGTKLLSADQLVYHDPDHPSAVILPVPG
jgi:uncharacterized protein